MVVPGHSEVSYFGNGTMHFLSQILGESCIVHLDYKKIVGILCGHLFSHTSAGMLSSQEDLLFEINPMLTINSSIMKAPVSIGSFSAFRKYNR